MSPLVMCENEEQFGRKPETASRDWETLARILHLQTKVAASVAASMIKSSNVSRFYHCSECDMCYGGASNNLIAHLCKCRLLCLVDEAFQGELESLRDNPEHVKHPLPRKVPMPYLCPLKSILYSQ